MQERPDGGGQADVPEAARELLRFWIAAGPSRWFTVDADFDAECRRRFLPLFEHAASGDLAAWRNGPDSALALVILLDQMPRNMFRGRRRAWDTDAAALATATDAVARGFDGLAEPSLRQFLYSPFMHAEDAAAQDRSVTLHQRIDDPDPLKWALHHRDIVARFGRFPHRNAVLGRESTPDELEFLRTSTFGV